MKITFSDDLDGTPAIVRRDTGEIFLNSKVWFDLPQSYRHFILCHELGHYRLKTTNELEADHFAFHQIAGSAPESLKNMVRTLSEVLPFSTDLQMIRLANIYRLGLLFDNHKEYSAERVQEIRRIENEIKNFYDQQLIDYMTTNSNGYEFPGYDPSLFDPSIGRWFRDISIEEAQEAAIKAKANEVPWPTLSRAFIEDLQNTPASGTEFMNSATSPSVAVPEFLNGAMPPAASQTVSLDELPAYELPFDLDLKSVAIGVLGLVILIIISKL